MTSQQTYHKLRLCDKAAPLPASDETPLVDEVGLLPTSEDNSLEVKSNGRRLMYRLGMMLAVVALVSVVIKVSPWRTDSEQPQAGELDAIQQKAASPSLCPANGKYFPGSKSCCLNTCGDKCGSSDCQSASAGYKNCCTSTFTKLCGSAGVVAPCRMPKTLAGVIQLLVDNLAALTGNPAGATAAAEAALSQLLGVPADDISCSLASSGSGGRRLTAAVNMNYKIRLQPSNTAVTGDGIAAKSQALKPILSAKLTSAGIPVTLEKVVLQTPASQEPGGVVATKPFPLLPTPPPVHTLVGLIDISSTKKDMILETQSTRAALAAALAEVLGIETSAVTVPGMSDGGDGVRVVAGYTVTVLASVPGDVIQGKSKALLPALQKEFLKAKVAVDVSNVWIHPPQVSTPTTTTAEVAA